MQNLLSKFKNASKKRKHNDIDDQIVTELEKQISLWTKKKEELTTKYQNDKSNLKNKHIDECDSLSDKKDDLDSIKSIIESNGYILQKELLKDNYLKSSNAIDELIKSLQSRLDKHLK
ncbi:hypothetical protein EI74_0543 [Mycoplasma testudineum]|uniref:Uncharacterized protein n=1 Tax=Mycoplasma testudineum TaxID=244584 RepID=A0A4R6ICD0_9MOLU|nr:hypothetical protein [Mycoplasma testudineum]OYD26768.1 hypothetical protein CG473_02320 [Mycoplasma testudineum]TDO19903.1 hypothetical protein EI74_0543 [Mycoplasma testudineum]